MCTDARIFIDGASKGNPGPSGIGVVIESNSPLIKKEFSVPIGEMTNNEAEYSALIFALEKALELGIKKVQIFADSELLVRQINGVYKIKNRNLIPLAIQAHGLIKKFVSLELKHIPREENKRANKLAQFAALLCSKTRS
jgi:ribonuclease HI